MQLVNDSGQYGIEGLFILLHVVRVVDGTDEASLQAIALHITLGQEVECVG